MVGMKALPYLILMIFVIAAYAVVRLVTRSAT
jgi:hypothetical protein